MLMITSIFLLYTLIRNRPLILVVKSKALCPCICFVFNKESNVVYTRFLSCHCDNCRTLDIDTMLRCTNKSTVPGLKRHELIKRRDKQPPNNRRKTDSNLQGIPS